MEGEGRLSKSINATVEEGGVADERSIGDTIGRMWLAPTGYIRFVEHLSTDEIEPETKVEV